MMKLHWIFNRFMGPEDDDASSGGGAVGTGNDERIAMLNRIGANADAERADQFQDVHDDDTTTPFVAGEIDEDGNVIAPVEEKETPTEDTPVDEPPPVVAKHKLKVNGVEKELTLEEVLALAQKADAADAKFQEAARLRAEAESLAPTKPPVQDVSEDSDEELLAQVRALQVGTEEEAVAALRKLKRNMSPPSLAPGDLYQVIDAKLAFNEANRIFREEFADVVQDPRLERMAMERDAELISAGDKRPYLERYREVGNELRAWRQELAKSAAPANSLTEKEARKAAAPAVPNAASVKAPQAQSDEEPEESVQQTIAKMSKSRGGPQWARS